MVSTDASEYKKLLFLLLPALFLSFALFFSAFRVLDCLKWYFKTLKVSRLLKLKKFYVSSLLCQGNQVYSEGVLSPEIGFSAFRFVMTKHILFKLSSQMLKIYKNELLFFSQLSLKNFEALLRELNQSIFMSPWCVFLFLRLFEKLFIKNISDFGNIIGRYSTAASDPGVAKVEPRFNMSHNVFGISWPWA